MDQSDRKTWWRVVYRHLGVALLAAAAAAVLTACSESADGSESEGQRLFRQQGCASCHSTGDNRIVGPGLGGIWEVAGERRPGMSEEEYLRESILDPNAYIVEGYRRGIMPRDYGRRLSEDDMTALIEYMRALEP